MSRIADIVAHTLARHSCKWSFGMPGGEVLTLVDALNAAGVRFILSRHESCAAIMAAGTYVVSRAPGVLVTTLGPGLANAMNGVCDASQERVPLLVLAGVVDHSIRHRYTHQVIDQRKLLAGVVKGTFEIEARGAGSVTARAISLAMTDPKGPVLIELAPGTAECASDPSDRAYTPPSHLKAEYRADTATVKLLAEKLMRAQSPLIIAGYEAALAGAGAAVRRVAEILQCPVLTTYKGKGVIPEDHELSLGAAGLSPLADRHLLPVAKSADVVLLVGFDPIELRQGWLDPFGDGAEIVEIAEAFPDHGMFMPTQRIAADPAPIMEALAGALSKRIEVPRVIDTASVKSAIDAAFSAPGSWGPHAVFATLQTAMPADATVTVDSGAHRILLSQMMRFDRPLALLQSAGFCTMGAALPLAIGVKTVEPWRPVFAVVGDGGLEMGIGELATVRDQRLPIVIIVLQDESLALIELKQRQAGLADAGVRLGRTRFEDIAPGFGGVGIRVASVETFSNAIDEALTRDTFTIIVCDVKASDYAGRL